ncbi:hypothetical protein [Methanoregula sp. PtaB.Bin085]|uniref:hypothetical protein n=1 Tax=Methanoregula sp. PtaB.Bin085 TaxID=1811680 RepID=UPI0025DD29BD|nr:hypothetical protein [Methanoregula sp. PtaB.Bin085]
MKELFQKRIIVNEFTDFTAFIAEFLLHATDEDANHVVVLLVVIIIVMVVLIMEQKMLIR